MLNNNQLQQAVRDELRFDPSFADGEIGVTADSGTVPLTGYVPSFAHKRFAERAAKRVAGVRQVTDEILVKLPDDIRPSDEEIAKRASRSLAWDVSVPSQVKATVEQGFITLTGHAEYGFERMAAEHAVGTLRGVMGISNRIALKHASPPETGIAANISKALDRLGYDPTTMSVSTEGRTVTLKGSVPSAYRRELAERTAWSAPGVSEVETHLTIN